MAKHAPTTIPATVRARVMARAWAIFRERYDYPRVPFASIGRHCFQTALAAAWAEAGRVAQLARHGTGALRQMLATLSAPPHRVGLSTSLTNSAEVIVARLRQRAEVEAGLAVAPTY